MGREKKREKKKRGERHSRDFPGRKDLVKTLPSNAEGVDSIPEQGARIPHVSQAKQKTEARL